MKLWKITLLSIIVLILLFVWIFIIGVNSKRPGSYFNTGNNAIWIEHKWVGDDVSEKEIAEMVLKLKKNQFFTVFVHTGPLKSDGTIDFETYKYAESFLEKARKYAPDIQYQTWLGQIRSSLDLSDPEVRKNIVNQSQILTKMIGFDGVHYDIEPVWDGDLDFIQLLKETRETLKEDTVISVALAEFVPQVALKTVGIFYDFVNYNSEINYKNVAKYADQIVVMVYDTSIQEGYLYRLLVREQLIWVSKLFKEKEVFIAIPSYDYTTKAFNPEVENMENGIKGIISGLNNARSRVENFAGLAIYPYWTIDENEWEIYQKLWLK